MQVHTYLTLKCTFNFNQFVNIDHQLSYSFPQMRISSSETIIITIICHVSLELSVMASTITTIMFIVTMAADSQPSNYTTHTSCIMISTLNCSNLYRLYHQEIKEIMRPLTQTGVCQLAAPLGVLYQLLLAWLSSWLLYIVDDLNHQPVARVVNTYLLGLQIID